MKSQIQRVILSSICSSRCLSFGGGSSCGFGGDGWGTGCVDGSCGTTGCFTGRGNDGGGVGVSEVTTTSSLMSSGEVLSFTGGGDRGGDGGGGAP